MPLRRRIVSRSLALALLVAPAATAAAQSPTNLGFEEARAGGGVPVPVGWYLGPATTGYELVIDTTEHLAGRASLRSRRLDVALAPADAGSRFGMASQTYPLALVRGRRLRLTGYIRTADVADGYAGFWMRVDGPSGMLALENMEQRGPRGTTPWTRYEVELPVDSGAAGVIFGIIHPGSGTAWFDSLTVEVVGPAMPRRVAGLTIPPRPDEDASRLLADAELAVPPDSAEPREDEAWAAWVRANARPVRSLGARDVSDLRFLAPLLAGKRIVQLGESGHGVAEFDLAKVRLIKYLHEELGYDVLAFESSVFECNRADRGADTLSPAALMRACIFGVWHAEEVVPLFEYLKETRRTNRPLILAGFDEQTSSATASARPAFLRSVVAKVDTAYARRVFDTDSTFLARQRGPDGPAYVQRERDHLVAFYDSLATFLRARERTLKAAFRDDPAAPIVARQAAVSMTFFVRQIAAGPSGAGTEIRDRGMADNLDFLLDELHPGKKVIVWAHNFHIQHRGRSLFATAPLTAADSAARPPRTMGTYVSERHRAELYTVGLFMYRGWAAMNNRQPYAVTRATPGSLESILHRAPWRYAFVDLSRAPHVAGTTWMDQRITAKEWGTNPQSIVPRDEYDGLLFIDTTHPPRYCGNAECTSRKQTP